MRVPDNYDAFLRHDAEQEARLAKRPICGYCEEPIQDDFLYDIGGSVYCERCLKEVHRHSTEDYER